MKRPGTNRAAKNDIRIRVTDEQRAMFEAAAVKDGMTLSAWMRAVAVKEARKVEKKNA